MTEVQMASNTTISDADRKKLREALSDVEHVRQKCKEDHELVGKLDRIKTLVTEVQV
jgi:hypothetical protein